MTDSDNHVLPLIDITRWNEMFREALNLVKSYSLSAPIILSSGWMGGMLTLCAKLFLEDIYNIDKIDLHSLYSMKDKAGPNSVEYIDQLSKPFTVGANKEQRKVYPLTDPVSITFPSGYRANTYRMDTPDHITLPITTRADQVHFRISFDSKLAMNGLVLLVKTNIWKLISGKRFESLRKGILYHPGSGGPHQAVIHITGTDKNGKALKREITILDPNGQTHLTSVGVLIQAKKIIESTQWKPNIYYPDQFPDDSNKSYVSKFLDENCIEVQVKTI